MAKRTRVNKTKAVDDFLKKNPNATPKEIADGLKLQGIEITVGHASNIKSKLKKARAARDLVRAATAATSSAETKAATMAFEPEPVSGDTITLEQIKKVAQKVREFGGFDRLLEIVRLAREVGGLRQFRDLLEAMSVAESDSLPQ